MAVTSVDQLLTVLSYWYLTQVQSENMGSGVLIFELGIGKNQKVNGEKWGVGGSETILHEDGFFNFSKITDDP